MAGGADKAAPAAAGRAFFLDTSCCGPADAAAALLTWTASAGGRFLSACVCVCMCVEYVCMCVCVCVCVCVRVCEGLLGSSQCVLIHCIHVNVQMRQRSFT